MIENKKEIIYSILIKGLNLTRETLTLCNFSAEDINELINEGIIKEKPTDKYQLVSINDLYRYGIKLMLINRDNKAIDCFRRCYQLEPTNREVCLQLMLIEFKSKNYAAVTKLLKIIEQIEPVKYQEDNKLYNYLLGIILYRNEEYREALDNTDPYEIIIPEDKEYPNKKIQNEIRRNITNKKYKYAIKLLNDIINTEIFYNVENELLKELVCQALTLDNNFRYKINTAAKEKKYERIIDLLNIKAKCEYLSNRETYIKIVAEAIVELINTKEIRNATTHNSKYLYDAIRGNNFILAQKINEEFLKKTRQLVEEDTLHILLEDIIKRINYIEQEQTNIQEALLEDSDSIQNIKIGEEIDLSLEEEFAYNIYIQNMDIDTAKKTYGLLPEQTLLIKLICARYYYNDATEESINEANKLVQEVENSSSKTYKVIKYLEEIKNNQEDYTYAKKSNNKKKKKKLL